MLQMDRERKLATLADGELQPILGFLRHDPKSMTVPEIISRLERSHDYLQRIISGDNYKERWEAVDKGEPIPEYEIREKVKV